MLAFFRSSGQRLHLFLQSGSRSLLTLFFGVLLPLLGFVIIAAGVYRQGTFSFERPLMLAVHTQAAPALDRLARSLTDFGNTPGMLPVTLILAACLYWLRPRSAYFLLLSLAGSVALHALLKQAFDRPRPALWTPLAPESDFSFPSGHAMFATSLVLALAVLLWHTRWRGAALVLGTGYVFTMIWSRVYSGVHYPTDVAAGVLVGLIWVMGLARLVHGHRLLTGPT